jgi:membrane-bound lytic murein transglycosylase D
VPVICLLIILVGCVQPGYKPFVSTDHTLDLFETPDFIPETSVAVDRIIEETIPTDKKNGETPPSAKNTEQILDESLDFCQVSQEFWQKGELESALEALDKAYSLILGVDVDDNPKLVQQIEDIRFTIAKRILEIYASRNIVVNGDHDAIPIVFNKHVQAEINLFSTGVERNFFIRAYKRSGRYRPFIVSALKEAGLPVELSWLPLIESGFKTTALSRARALGLWQFIPSTGYKFGLKRNTFIDERLDPEKSTHAAIAYMSELHRIFGDWTTVLAAYNCGEGRVLRVIRSQNVKYLDNFWDLYQRLPRETARYVPRFLATLHIINNPEKYGLDTVSVDPPLAGERVTVSRQIHLKNLARAMEVPQQTLKVLNPELRYNILPREEYQLKIPPGKTEVLLAKLNDIASSSRPDQTIGYHRIRKGESLSTIAKRYGTSVRRLAVANNIYKTHRIVAGNKLKIPLTGPVRHVEHSPKTRKKSKPGKKSVHIVRSGENLWIVARRYRTTTKHIQRLNGLSTTRLHIGQRLQIAERESEIPEVEGIRVYPVKPGDSPFKIAQRHAMSLERFLRINRLTPRSKIYPGQKLYVE